MGAVIRSLGVVVLALASTVAVAVAWTTAATVQLLATALIMGGTDHPLTSDDTEAYIEGYLDNAIEGYINPAAGEPTGTGFGPISTVAAGDPRYAVTYPADFFPIFGPTTFGASVAAGRASLSGCIRGNDDCTINPDVSAPQEDLNPADPMVVFGYSQSAAVASLVKRDLLADPNAPTDLSFFLLANPMRPNGGVLARSPFNFTIPFMNIPFYGATPTNSCDDGGPCYETVDVAKQYDGLGGDAPASLTNVLAILNAAAGYYYFHSDMQFENFDGAQYQGSHGDTDYYLIPARRLPILKPVEGFIPSPILTLIDAPLRVLIEGAYARDVSPGVATKVGLLPFRNPIQTAINLLRAIPTGIDDALAEVTGNPDFRPLGTAPVDSPYGVGGPSLPAPPAEESDESAIEALSVGDDNARRGNGDGELLDPSDGDSVDENVDEDQVVTDGQDEVVPDGQDEVVSDGQDEVVTDGQEDAGDENGREDGADGQNGDTPPVTDPTTPKVRGPISFDSREPGEAASTTDTGGDQTTTGEPASDDGDDAGEAPAA